MAILKVREQRPRRRILSDNNDVGICRLIFNASPFGLWMLILSVVPSAKSPLSAAGETVRREIFAAKGVVQSINRDERQLVIRHETVSNCMAAMTMPSNLKTVGMPAALQDGDEIYYQLISLKWEDGWIMSLSLAFLNPAVRIFIAMHKVRAGNLAASILS